MRPREPIKLTLFLLFAGMAITLATGALPKGLADDPIPYPGVARRGLPLPWLTMKPLHRPHTTYSTNVTFFCTDVICWALLGFIPAKIVEESRETRRKARLLQGLPRMWLLSNRQPLRHLPRMRHAQRNSRTAMITCVTYDRFP